MTDAVAVEMPSAEAVPIMVERGSHDAWYVRFCVRHTRHTVDRTICENLCRCDNCPETGIRDTRTCPEYCRIYGIIREIVEDEYISKESLV
jgi:hypothetical protein